MALYLNWFPVFDYSFFFLFSYITSQPQFSLPSLLGPVPPLSIPISVPPPFPFKFPFTSILGLWADQPQDPGQLLSFRHGLPLMA